MGLSLGSTRVLRADAKSSSGGCWQLAPLTSFHWAAPQPVHHGYEPRTKMDQLHDRSDFPGEKKTEILKYNETI